MTYPNDTARSAASVSEKLLLQWPRFDDSRYLRIDQGKAFDYLVDFFNVDPGTIGARWLGNKNANQLQVGSDKSSLDVYRGIVISNVRLHQLAEERSFNAFPLTMLKNGEAYVANESDAAIAAKYDNAVINQFVIEGMDLAFWLAYGTSWSTVNFDNCNFRFCYFERSRFKNFTFENTDFFQCAFGFQNNPTLTPWFAGIISNCGFISCNLSQVDSNLGGTVFQNCDFKGATLLYANAETALRIGASYDCDFEAVNLRFLFNYAMRCNFTWAQAVTGTINKLGNIYDSVFRHASITNAQIGYLQNCNFNKTNFTGTLTLAANANVQGCDFGGSNLNTVTGGYASKNLFKAALDALGTNRYDATTIWVDGTSIMEA